MLRCSRSSSSLLPVTQFLRHESRQFHSSRASAFPSAKKGKARLLKPKKERGVPLSPLRRIIEALCSQHGKRQAIQDRLQRLLLNKCRKKARESQPVPGHFYGPALRKKKPNGLNMPNEHRYSGLIDNVHRLIGFTMEHIALITQFRALYAVGTQSSSAGKVASRDPNAAGVVDVPTLLNDDPFLPQRKADFTDVFGLINLVTPKITRRESAPDIPDKIELVQLGGFQAPRQVRIVGVSAGTDWKPTWTPRMPIWQLTRMPELEKPWMVRAAVNALRAQRYAMQSSLMTYNNTQRVLQNQIRNCVDAYHHCVEEEIKKLVKGQEESAELTSYQLLSSACLEFKERLDTPPMEPWDPPTSEYWHSISIANQFKKRKGLRMMLRSEEVLPLGKVRQVPSLPQSLTLTQSPIETPRVEKPRSQPTLFTPHLSVSIGKLKPSSAETLPKPKPVSPLGLVTPGRANAQAEFWDKDRDKDPFNSFRN